MSPSRRPKYPDVPGTKRGSPDTAFAAGAIVKIKAASIRKMSLQFVATMGIDGAICDEVAKGLRLEVHYASRPRLSELVKMGLIADSGFRRRGLSGRFQTVWVLAKYAPAARRGPQLTFFELLEAA